MSYNCHEAHLSDWKDLSVLNKNKNKEYYINQCQKKKKKKV